MTPEDKTYRDVMMLYSDHPVKPKYWYEDYGDYWSCSCGQVNRDDTCSNCGLDRALLKELFKSGNLDAPAPAASVARSSKKGASSKDDKDPGSDDDNTKADQTEDDTEIKATDDSETAVDGEEYEYIDEEAVYARRKRRTRRIMIVLLLMIFLLGGGLAAFYFYALPELDRRDQLYSDATRDTLVRELPEAVAPLSETRFDIYRYAGDSKYEDKEYEKAIEYYNKALEIKSDESIKQKILAAKFSYVSANQEEGGKTFRKYLAELKKENYPGIQDIYERTYDWKASIVTNNASNDYSTDMSSISRQYAIYFHTTLSGGPPDEQLDLYYEIIWPDGTSERKSVSGSKGDGETVSTRCQYTFPPTPNEGRLTYKLYNNSNNKMMATDSIVLAH